MRRYPRLTVLAAVGLSAVGLFALGCAPATPAPAPEEEPSASSTADIAPTESAGVEESAAPSASESAAPAASTATPLSTGGNAGPVNCPELAKKKCQVTRGCAWNDVQKCIKEEGAP